MYKTKRLLFHTSKQTTTKIKLALLDLLNTKQLSQISITNLVKVAGVYRATFYLHYKSLNDVIVDIENDVIDSYDAIKDQMQNVDLFNNINILVDKITEYIKIDKKYLRMIINTNCFNRITLKLREILKEILISNFIKFGHMGDDDKDLYLAISLFSGSVVFVLRDWIECMDIEQECIQSHINKLGEYLLKKSSN